MDARTATADDFDKAAQQHANATWVWVIVTALVVWIGGWFALIPGFLAILSITKSVTATSCATKLRAGTYSIPNPNNGAPDGDAQNTSR